MMVASAREFVACKALSLADSMGRMRKACTSYARTLAVMVMLGLFSPFQTIFACDVMDGTEQLVCCCDEPCVLDMQADSQKNDTSTRCCDVYLDVDSGNISASHSGSLDHAQVPPLPVSSPGFVAFLRIHRLSYRVSAVSLSTDHRVYLLTSRFLI